MLTTVLILVGSVLGAYVVFNAVLYKYQDALIFPRPKPDLLVYQQLAPFSSNLKTSNGALLQGWRIEDPSQENTVLIFFGGNAQDAASNVPLLQQLNATKAYTFNYRGYGLSDGEPSESGLYADALEIYDHVAAENPNHKIVVVGYSLGSAVAGYVAKHRSPPSLILICPLYSIARIAKERFYALSMLIKHPFELHRNVSDINSNTLYFIADSDAVIPNNHSICTYESSKGNKQLVTIINGGHNDILGKIETRIHLNDFIRQGCLG